MSRIVGLALVAFFHSAASLRHSEETKAQLLLDDEEDVEAKDLCGKSLIISYKQEEHDYKKEGLWILAPGEWEEARIVDKLGDDGCAQSYRASCTKGMIVTKICGVGTGEETTEVLEHRCLGSGVGDCSVFYPNSRGTDLQTKKGETAMQVYDPEGEIILQAGRVSWVARDMPNAGGLELSPISKGTGGTTWSAASGCYCCKHSYGILHSPFCYISSVNTVPRVAWKKKDGTQECMNAWQFIDDDDVGMLVPDFIYMIVDTFTLSITSNSACAIACASRNKAKFPEHSHSYKKHALSDPSCS